MNNITDEKLIEMSNEEFQKCHDMMEEYCAGTDGLKYGWDWPTFSELFPEQRMKYRAIIEEGRKRGLHKNGKN